MVSAFLNFPLVDQLNKILERPIVRPFGVIGKTASRQFPAFQMIRQAIAAFAFAFAWLVTAVAGFEYMLLFAVHGLSLSKTKMLSGQPPGDTKVHSLDFLCLK